MPNMKILVTQAAVMFSNMMIPLMMILTPIILVLVETRRKTCMGSQGYLPQHYHRRRLIQITKFVEVLVVELLLVQLLHVVRLQDAMQKKETG